MSAGLIPDSFFISLIFGCGILILKSETEERSGFDADSWWIMTGAPSNPCLTPPMGIAGAGVAMRGGAGGVGRGAGAGVDTAGIAALGGFGAPILSGAIFWMVSCGFVGVDCVGAGVFPWPGSGFSFVKSGGTMGHVAPGSREAPGIIAGRTESMGFGAIIVSLIADEAEGGA